MKYIMTFFWSFLFLCMTTYVVASIVNVPWNLQSAAIASVIVAALSILTAMALPKEAVPSHADAR